jgi:hypothetical protein
MARKATKTGKKLERWVANAYRQMGAQVKHDVRLAGNQIDVYVELETQDRGLHRIAVEAKDWTSTVGIGVVNKFAIVADLLRSRWLIDEGVIVSALGFSKEARDAADTHGIRLLEPADLDAMVVKAEAAGRTQPIAPAGSSPPPPVVRRTENLDAQILQILRDYLHEHLGDPKMNLNELIGTLGATRADVIRYLHGLKEKGWLDYSLTEGAESGLVWLTRLGTRVAEDTPQN